MFKKQVFSWTFKPQRFNLQEATKVGFVDIIDFARPVRVVVNGESQFYDTVEQSAESLLRLASRDLDRSMLITAELSISLTD